MKDQMADMRDNVIQSVSDANHPSEDIPMVNLADQPQLDAKLMVNASEGTEREKRRKRKRKADKVNVQSEVQVMDKIVLNVSEISEDAAGLSLSPHPISIEMSMGSTGNLMDIKDKVTDNLGVSDDMKDPVIKSESDTNILSNDVRIVNLAEHPELDAKLASGGMERKRRIKKKRKINEVHVQGEVQVRDKMLLSSGSMVNVTGINEDEVAPSLSPHPKPYADIAKKGCTRTQQTEMSNGGPENHMEMKDKMNDNLGVSDDMDHVIKSKSDTDHPSNDVPVVNLAEHSELEAKLMSNATEETERKKGRRKKRKNNTVNDQGEVQVMDKMEINDKMSNNLGASDDLIDHAMKSKSDTDHPSNDVSVVNLEAKLMSDAPEETERKKGRRKKRKDNTVNVQGEVQVMDKMLLTSGTLVNVTGLDQDEAALSLSPHTKLYAGSTQVAFATRMDEVESMNRTEMNIGTAENLAEAKDQMDHHAEAADKLQDCRVVNSLSENKLIDIGAISPLVAQHPGSDRIAKGKSGSKSQKLKNYRQRSHIRKRQRANLNSEIENMNHADAMYKILQPDDLSVAGTGNDHNSVLLPNESDVVGISSKVSPGSLSQHPFPLPTPMGLDRDSDPCESKHVSTNLDLKQENRSSTGLGQYPRISSEIRGRRKLLVLDVNGLLAHIEMPAPKDRRADAHILRRAIFKRPFCDDFLNFCFKNFDVGIWSSRSKVLIDRVVDYLLGNRQRKLQFCWNMSHATQSGYKTLENHHKPLVCKELKKIWEVTYPDSRWNKGDYDESNTLLLDDSPYKALLNPLHNAIFPSSYNYEDDNDNSLGPGGDLRVYLEGLLACDNVQKYVEQNPFGQGAINETNSSWGFYSGVLDSLSNKLEINCPSSPTSQNQELPHMQNQEIPPMPVQELPPTQNQESPPTQNQESPPMPVQELPPTQNQESPPTPEQELPTLLTN